LHDDEFHDLYFSEDTSMNKSKRMRLAELASCMGEWSFGRRT
jgi:hypothetical protein